MAKGQASRSGMVRISNMTELSNLVAQLNQAMPTAHVTKASAAQLAIHHLLLHVEGESNIGFFNIDKLKEMLDQKTRSALVEMLEIVSKKLCDGELNVELAEDALVVSRDERSIHFSTNHASAPVVPPNYAPDVQS